MHAIILAAGRSQRIKPVEDKNFLKFLGKTLIEHQIENVKAAGFEKITIIGGAHNLEELKKFNTDVVEQENLEEGMAGAMMALEGKVDEPVMVLSANDYLEQEAFEAMKEAAAQTDATCLMLAKKVTSYFPGGYIAVDGNRITQIVEKPGEGNEPSDMINIVLHWHKSPQDFKFCSQYDLIESQYSILGKQITPNETLMSLLLFSFLVENRYFDSKNSNSQK